MTILATSRRVLSTGHLRVQPRNAVCQARWESKAVEGVKTVRDTALPSMRQNKQAEPTDRQTALPLVQVSRGAQNAQTQVDKTPWLSEAEEAKLDTMRDAQSEIRGVLDTVLRQFSAPIRYAFAYGSGVYKQSGYGASKPMVDLIFGVSHPDHWHALNIAQHRNHYSFMGTLGANAVSFVQDRMGAGVYYNPFIEINGVVVKYGVVSMSTLSSDLLNWDSLYLAGRMHKPTLTLRRDPLMRISKQVNLTHAVRAALLMLPKTFTTEELFVCIASLSFTGDIRMRIGGENPRKVQNIVEAQLPLFKSRYT
ncbi:Mitochondrial translocator assembly and maintenance protein 41, partial [Coemansia sp. RSA 678]